MISLIFQSENTSLINWFQQRLPFPIGSVECWLFYSSVAQCQVQFLVRYECFSQRLLNAWEITWISTFMTLRSLYSLSPSLLLHYRPHPGPSIPPVKPTFYTLESWRDILIYLCLPHSLPWKQGPYCTDKETFSVILMSSSPFSIKESAEMTI